MSVVRVAVVDDELWKVRAVTEHFDEGDPVTFDVYRSVEALEKALVACVAPYDLALIDFLLAAAGLMTPHTGLRAINLLAGHAPGRPPRFIVHTNPANRDRRAFLAAAHTWYGASLLLPDTTESRISVRDMVLDPGFDVTPVQWRVRLRQGATALTSLLDTKTPARSALQWLSAIATYDGHPRSVTQALGVPARAYAEASRKLYAPIGAFTKAMSSPAESGVWQAVREGMDDSASSDQRVTTFARVNALFLSAPETEEAYRRTLRAR